MKQLLTRDQKWNDVQYEQAAGGPAPLRSPSLRSGSLRGAGPPAEREI